MVDLQYTHPHSFFESLNKNSASNFNLEGVEFNFQISTRVSHSSDVTDSLP